MKHLAALAAVLALELALLEPAAAAGLKFSVGDLKSGKSTWRLYQRWGKRYHVGRKPADMLRRFATFNQTAHRVAWSRVRVAGEPPRLNVFADATDEELREYRCRMLEDPRRNLATATPGKREGSNGTLPLPDSVDWRSQNCNGAPCLSPVKDQGPCGSCWAIAATGALESRLAISGPAVEEWLSDQELVDCDHGGFNDGCKGGRAYEAFRYVFNNGVASSESYPYMGVNGTCHANSTARVPMMMRGFARLPAGDESQLISELTYAPLVVSIAVGKNNTDFIDHPGGVYRGMCGDVNDHELLLVGFNQEYYIMKNSYGEFWGDDGYLYLPRNRSCGMRNDGGYFPLMDD